jgi:glycosyltransferase involved in cell wall biosynthesis
MRDKVNVSVIILTFNEEANIAQALNSVYGWAQEVFVLDSLSTDKTCEIASKYTSNVLQHEFKGFPQQRNYAIKHLLIKTGWIFFLDADEWLTEELKKEIAEIIIMEPEENGFYIKRRFIWMGTWIKKGYYPIWLLRLFRYGKGYCEDRTVNEHIIVDGKVGHLKNDFVHEDLKSITEWIARQNRFASLEAEELVKKKKDKYIETSFFGTQAERKRWLRYNIWNKLPPLIRPFLYFGFRYILRGGFLDGRKAFIYHFLQGLWVPFLIDIKYLELKETKKLW